ncbi:MAG: hypothetical protein KKB70_03685 [Proteobacteria bacterium]|nr:hypothetical protein [Pseudomonadota bacterium]MBU1612337.1 hypothetical protein [Pseudomonadota bacterium]
MISELLSGMAHSTTQGMVGVSLIFVYMVWIIAIGLIRVGEAMAEDKAGGHH